MNENGAFVNGASVNEIGASVKQNGASVNENGAFVNDYTHSEAIRRPFNHSNNCGRVPLKGKPCKSPHLSPATSSSVQKDTKQSSSTVPVQEQAGSPSTHRFPVITLTSFSDLTRCNQQLIPAVNQLINTLGNDAYCSRILGVAEDTIDKSTPEFIDHHIATPGYKLVMVAILERFRGILESRMEELATWANMSPEELWPLLFYPALEVVVRAFQMDAAWSNHHKCTIDGHHHLVAQLNESITVRREKDADAPVERKVTIFKETVELRNKYGWSFKDDTEAKNAVCISPSYLKQIGRVFELNPHLTPGPLVDVLWECIWWSRQPAVAREKHYWSRLGVDLGTFCRKLDLIVAEIDMREECPVAQL